VKYVIDARRYVQTTGVRANQLGNGILRVLLVELLRGPIGLNVAQSELYLISYSELLYGLPGPVGIFLL